MAAFPPGCIMSEMERRVIETDRAPRPAGAYSQGIRVGDLIFVAGQGPADAETGQVRGATVAEQTIATIANVRAILRAAGADLQDVVKTTVHLSDLSDFSAFDAAYREAMPGALPVRTTVGSALAGILVEIDVIAVAAPRAA